MLCDLEAASAPLPSARDRCGSDELPSRAVVEREVNALIGDRRRRCGYFPGHLFADPAWDILLLLALAASREHRLSVTGICSSMDAPTTTALRWIAKLTDEGLLVRRHDRLDKRRKYIELSPEAYRMMAAYCSTSGPRPALAA